MRPARRPNIGGGLKPSVKEPDPFDVTPEEYTAVGTYTDDEIRTRLLQRDLHPQLVEDLIVDRETAGAKWRIAQVLYR